MNKSPPVIDAEVFWLRLENSIEALRQKMMISAALADDLGAEG